MLSCLHATGRAHTDSLPPTGDLAADTALRKVFGLSRAQEDPGGVLREELAS